MQDIQISKVFVLVPSLIPTGPIRGAVALCNGLVGHIPVVLVVLKPGGTGDLHINPTVERLELGCHPSWVKRRWILHSAYRAAGGRNKVVSISFCFSADFINLTLKRDARIISSVRGNLPINYRHDYGCAGILLAWVHLGALNYADQVVAMSDAMVAQMRRYGLNQTVVIGNFVDEITLNSFRGKPRRNEKIRFLFLGRLSTRKRPDLLLETAKSLVQHGYDFRMDFVGEGPLGQKLQAQMQDAGLESYLTFHNHLDSPYALLQEADYLVLPSESEGISRACLEALFFGVPCVLRDVEASRELISPGVNGDLFEIDMELTEVLQRILITRTRKKEQCPILLPDKFRQTVNVKKFLDLLTL